MSTSRPFLNAPYGAYLAREEPPPDDELVRVGPGTPCGEYLRRFWQPVAFARDLTDVPLRIRIMSEDLVVFRDKAGRVGLLQLHCAHRGTSLEYGLISDRGIRCCYHGWVYDVDGTILETPGEPASSTLKDRLCQGAYPVHEYGAYHVRTNIYFADLGKFFYSAPRVFEVTDAHPIWQQTVGVPDGAGASGEVRTYSLMTNRFPDHTSLYVRVQDKDTGVVYATYSLGRTIAFEQPQAEIDRANRLHVLHCAAPRPWSYARVGLNGELLQHSSFMETKTRPHLVHSGGGEVAVRGGMVEAPAQNSANKAPKLSARPAGAPMDDQ